MIEVSNRPPSFIECQPRRFNSSMTRMSSLALGDELGKIIASKSRSDDDADDTTTTSSSSSSSCVSKSGDDPNPFGSRRRRNRHGNVALWSQKETKMFYLRIAHDDEVQLPSCFTEAERRRIRGEAGEDKVVYDVVEETIKASNMFSSATATIDVHRSHRGAITANQLQERKSLMENVNMIRIKKNKHPKRRNCFSLFMKKPH